MKLLIPTSLLSIGIYLYINIFSVFNLSPIVPLCDIEISATQNNCVDNMDGSFTSTYDVEMPVK